MTTIESNPANQNYRTLLNSATIEQHRNRAVFSATIPLDLVKQLTNGTP
jgi:hypothetical protein